MFMITHPRCTARPEGPATLGSESPIFQGRRAAPCPAARAAAPLRRAVSYRVVGKHARRTVAVHVKCPTAEDFVGKFNGGVNVAGLRDMEECMRRPCPRGTGSSRPRS